MLLNHDRFETDVLGSAEPVLVDFYGTFCPPCRQLAPTIDRLANDGYSVCKVNIQERPDLARKFGVNVVPTLVIVQAGQEVGRMVGLQPERKLRDALDSVRPA